LRNQVTHQVEDIDILFEQFEVNQIQVYKMNFKVNFNESINFIFRNQIKWMPVFSLINTTPMESLN